MVSVAEQSLIDATKVRLTAYIPHVPTIRQQVYLWLMAREVFFGGSAGGGKSDALLMGALQYVDVPGYAALLLRRTFADLNKPEALIPRSHEWLAGTDAKWNEQKHQWTFPSGATLSFGYLQTENDKYQYQGAAYQYIGFDELTQFSKPMYTYLFSRLRRLEGSPVPLRFRAASNPGGIGHDWVFTRFLSAEAKRAGRIFVQSKLSDNPHLDAESYIESLSELDDVERAQLLDGDWLVQRTDGVIPRRFIDRCREPKELPPDYLLPVELGMDVGGGGDFTTIHGRAGRKLLGNPWRGKTHDTMQAVAMAMQAIEATGATAIKIDAIGVGKGTADRLEELRREGKHGCRVVPVYVGSAPYPSASIDPAHPERGVIEYANLKAQMHWEIGRGLTEAGVLDLSEMDLQTEMDLIAPMWWRNSSGRIVVESKAEVRKRLGRSTDDGDAVLNAFFTPPPEAPAGMWVDDDAQVTIGADV